MLPAGTRGTRAEALLTIPDDPLVTLKILANVNTFYSESNSANQVTRETLKNPVALVVPISVVVAENFGVHVFIIIWLLVISVTK
jgi:hypothetical protein